LACGVFGLEGDTHLDHGAVFYGRAPLWPSRRAPAKQRNLVIHYREFRNSDPPALVDIWRGAEPHALARSMNVSLLQDLVLGKPYFDRRGLILAVEGETPVGFGHAGFGPAADRQGLSHETGVICMVVVRPSHRRQGIGREVVLRLEQYLVQHGARLIYAGGVRPMDPFYSGLYGGSLPPGVLESDTAARGLFDAMGYRVVDHLRRLRCDLANFRPLVDRRQLLIRRNAEATSTFDPPASNWWEACTLGEFHRMRFDLRPRRGGQPQASAVLWSLDPIHWRPGERTVGLSQVQVSADQRRQGLATFLLGEAFRELREHGYSHVETQVLENDEAAGRLLAKLGFTQVDRGSVYRKEVGGA
jgi:ribosomal protein S18 acetylase RimI-like enzyme